jgi:hypothetical protein
MIRSILIALLVIVIFIPAVQAGDSNEKIYGIWVNKENEETQGHPRWDYNSDGTWSSYLEIEDEPIWKGKYTITEKWTDSKKNVWYKIKWKNTITSYSGFGLIKISDSGNTFEHQFALDDYPSKIDPNEGFWKYSGILKRK